MSAHLIYPPRDGQMSQFELYQWVERIERQQREADARDEREQVKRAGVFVPLDLNGEDAPEEGE
jgi:hypothetical protein